MFKVLLVDDEQWALMGLKSSLAWERAGLTVVCETTNSVAALETIERLKPDVVFSDIRMPVYSGLDLMRICRERGITSEFIIVSGYAEFEYAKSALKYGAFDYLLKPINEDELQKLASKLVVHLSEKSVSERGADLFDFEALFEQSEIGPGSRYASFQACLLSGVAPNDIAAAMAIKDVSSFILKVGHGQYMVLLNFAPAAVQAVEEAVGELLRQANRSDGSTGAGFSETAARLTNWNKLLNQAFKAYASGFLDADRPLRRYTRADTEAVKQLVDRFFTAATARRADELGDLCRSLPATFKQPGFGIEAVEYFHNSLSVLYRYKYGERFAEAALEPLTYNGLAAKHKNIDDYVAYLSHACGGYASGQSKPTASDEDFGRLLSHIHAHFSEDLYLGDLSRDFHISPTYLCELFRKKTGQTFTKYINELRLDKAREYMLLSDISMAEISEKVGFKDYFYFSKLFKKNVGVSPAQYRKGEFQHEKAL
ncbi:response regulator transcription factor [Cohnella sp. 56]|uniref:response regulator transcription factor n=1 Tax=Cohnella sp. 56 TaxID=3113722 RepID=UPI0030E9650A